MRVQIEIHVLRHVSDGMASFFYHLIDLPAHSKLFIDYALIRLFL